MDRLSVIRRSSALRAGYSLVEVVVASVIVSIFVVGIFTILSGSSDLDRRETLRRRVFQELERTLEKPKFSSRSPYYSDLAPTGGTFVNLPQVTLDSAGGVALKVTPQVKVDTLTFTFGAVNIPSKRVTVKIAFTDKGVAYSESLETIITLTDIN